jgi:hypothetical protein
MKQLSCARCRARWDDLLSKSTFADSPESAEVRAHLETCADCRKAFNLLVAAREELHRLPAQKAPASLRADILSQIESQPKTEKFRLSGWFVSPQRLAWAGGALVTIFLVALLIRPERRTAVFQTVPEEELSNHEQMREHNNAYSQKVSPQATLPLHHKPGKKSMAPAKTKPRHADSVKPSLPAAAKSKPAAPQKKIEKIIPAPAPAKMPAIKKSPGLDVIPPQVRRDVLANGVQGNQDRSVPKEASPTIHSADNYQAPLRRSAPAGLAAPQQAFKAEAISPVIHWSKTITSDYDVAHAAITMTLEEGLAFEDNHPATRTLWEGALHRGQQISLNIDLQRTSGQEGKLRLKMIDTETQKVLLEKELTVK